MSESKPTYYEIDTMQKAQIKLDFKEFVKSGSIYQRFDFKALPNSFGSVRPTVVNLPCALCGKVNPFRVPFRLNTHKSVDFGRNTPGPNNPESSFNNGVYVIGLECTGCESQEFVSYILIDAESGTATKVGQAPAPSIEISDELASSLGDDAEIYRRGKISLNLTYGVGASAYLRRVLENQIDPLLQSLREQRASEGASSEELNQLDKIINGKIAADKIAAVGPILPESIRVDGDNPLKLVYDELSSAIHSRDEQEATEAAQECIEVLDNLLSQLANELKARHSRTKFSGAVRKLRGSRS